MSLPGFTRSCNRRDYLLQTPDTFVRTPLPGLCGGWAIVHTAPRLGADFAMTTVEFDTGGTLDDAPAQRFVFVLEGEILLSGPQERAATLRAGGYVFLPAGTTSHLVASIASRVILIEKHYKPVSLKGEQLVPHVLTGKEADQPATALNGDPDLQVRCLLPSAPDFDFAVNTMTYAPGASLSQVELHYMEHGLLMLEGSGIYRLGEDWHPVAAGDFIWMAPGCPQWFAAVGKIPAKYLIYKDFHRHVLA